MLNPALNAFVDRFATEQVFGQALVSRSGAGFELRHVEDRSVEGLKRCSLKELRALAQFTTAGAFRPMKSAPTLRRGWQWVAPNSSALAEGLDTLYPGALADWFAADQPESSVTDFRAFMDRQTGMYRTAAMLSDPQAARVTAACCAPSLCLKRRLWTVPGLEPDAPGGKSLIPCLEACALFLEFARKAMRIEQEEGISLVVAPSDLATIRAALVAAAGMAASREGDVASAENPRRALLALAKLGELSAPPVVSGE
jgi:hypothetical protein